MTNTLSTLLTTRYGKNFIHVDFELDSTLKTLLSHKSIRNYLDKPLPDGILELMIAAAQSAASSSNLQLWSVVAITDTERKKRLAELSNNQSQITQAPLFLVWLADVNRLENIMEKDNLDTQGLYQLDLFLIAIIDAALAAQNAVIAAESQGLGTVYIGALRNNVTSVSTELQLPNGVFPVFGLCVGYPNPDKIIAVKPRLSQQAVLHKEIYQPHLETEITSYNEIMATFYEQQKMNVVGTWAKHCSDRIQARASNSELQAFLAEQFGTKISVLEKKMKKRFLALTLFTFCQLANAETIFVTLEKDNALAVLNPIDGKVEKTIPVGKRPRGIALSPDNKTLYIATSDDNTIKIFDAQTLKQTGKLPSGEDPEAFALNPKGDKMYVSNEDDSLVTVIDLAKKKISKQIKVGVEPEGICVSADNQWLISASETTNMVHWIDIKTQTIVENTLVDARPRYVTFTDDSSQLWVTSEMAGTLTILDTKTKHALKTLTFSIQGMPADKIQPVGIAIDKERKYAYVALGTANRVAVINAQTLEIEKYLLVGARVWHLAFSPDQKQLYSANGASNDVSIIDLKSHTVLKSIGVGTSPWGIAVKP